MRRLGLSAVALGGALVLASAMSASAFVDIPAQGPTAGGTAVTLQGAGLLFPSIAAGSQHNLYLDGAGHVWAAGVNTAGELGDGSTTSTRTLTPVLLPAGVTITSIAAARMTPGTSYAVDSSGAVWAWGSDASGQLGNGVAGANRATPAAITTLPPMSAVSAGGLQAIGLTTTGTVWGWGGNAFGQAGHAGTSFAAAAVAGLPAGITAVSAGGDFSLALAPDGSVWAWGNNVSGQLGRGTTTGTFATPAAVTGLPPIVEISAGGQFAMARAADGRIFTWGANGLGQLGNGAVGGTSGTPQQVTIAPVSSMSAGGVAALVVLADGSTRAWGGDLSGQLGDNSTGTKPTPITPQLPVGSTVAHVYSGGNTSMWVLANGNVALAGDNVQGQFGVGATANYIFIPAIAPLALTGVTFGGTAATAVSRSGTDVLATTPAHASGVVDTSVAWTYGTTAITVVAPASFTFGVAPTVSGAAGDVLAGATVDYTYTRTGDELPTVTVTSGTLPPGLGIDTTGHLTGSPTTAGTFTFTLTASNGLGSVALDDTIVVTALLVATDPGDQTVFESETATFDATAQSLLTPVSVQWQTSSDGGTTWTDAPGGTGDSFTTAPTVLTDDGTLYRAVFTNSAGSVATAAATLTVQPALVVLTNPVDVTVDDGQTATFTASAESFMGPLALLAVQWQRSTDQGGTWSNIAGATSDSYATPPAVASDDGTLFRAVYTVGGAERITSAARLTVLGEPTPDDLAPSGADAMGSAALGAALLGFGLIVVARRRRARGH